MTNPRVSRLLVAVTWIEVAVLTVAGGGLLIASPAVSSIWPWPLAPFNLRFLGALYTAALVAATIQAASGRWSPARVVTWMIFVFTLVVTVCSFVHLPRFDPARVEVWIWFGLYVGVCANAGAHLWAYRRWASPGRRPAAGAAAVLLGKAAVLGVAGAALLCVPETAASLWPWKIDRFHAQLYSVTFLTPAAGALVLRRAVTRGDWSALGATQLAWGTLPVVALWVADGQARRIDWHTPATWIWIGLFAGIAVMGAWMLSQTLRNDTRHGVGHEFR